MTQETTEAAADGRLQGIAECLAYVKGIEVLRLQESEADFGEAWLDLSLMERVEMTLAIVADGIRGLYAAARGG